MKITEALKDRAALKTLLDPADPRFVTGSPEDRKRARAGHSDLSTTQRYIDLAGVLFRDEADAAEARMFGIVAPVEDDG